MFGRDRRPGSDSNGVMTMAGCRLGGVESPDSGQHEGLHRWAVWAGWVRSICVDGAMAYDSTIRVAHSATRPASIGLIHRARNGAVKREAVANSRSDSSKARWPRTISGSCSTM